MEISRIREQLQKLNLTLENIQMKTKTNLKLKKYIPEFKLDSYKEKLKSSVRLYIEQLMNQIAAKHKEINKEEILKRQEYAERQIKHYNKLIKEYDSEKINTIKNLISTIEHLKEYDSNPLPTIHVSKEDTVKIFKFLSEIRLEDKYAYLKDYLQRKIKFEYKVPTQKEIETLERLKDFLNKKL